MDKLRIWNAHQSWEEAEEAWDTTSGRAAKKHPIKGLKRLPKIPGITEETAKGLKWKAFKYMLTHDHDGDVRRGVLHRPLRYGLSFLKSALRKKSFSRDGDFFLYGVDSIERFQQELKDPKAIFVLGFSYCEKPFECPSGRFTPECIHDAENPVCQQCKIGKCLHAVPAFNTVALAIPTIHYIGARIFDIAHANPGSKILFMITACELVLEMFGDWGNMVDIQGIGIRFGGRICNTMKAFELSEAGIKPGLTVVLDEAHRQMLHLIRTRREALQQQKCEGQGSVVRPKSSLLLA